MKKRIFTAIALLLLIVPILSFYGCGDKSFEYESMLEIDAQFKGTRTITLNTGSELLNDAEAKAKFNEVINEYCPSSLQREELEQDGSLKYIFTLNFDSRADYISKLSLITGKQVQATLVIPSSELAKGWRYVEDFAAEDFFFWLKSGIEEAGFSDLKYTLSCLSNIVNYNGDIRSSTGEDMTEVNAVTGYPVTGIYIETTNNKKDSYDRTFTISVPQQTYEEMGDKLINIMKERTLPAAAYSGWTQQGNNQEYEIVYNGLSLAELQNATALFLDCDTVSIYYGDKNNSSTPLAEQLVFEEEINTLSFVSKDGSKVDFSYKYSLPIRTTHGEGVQLKNGVWEKTGEWIDGIYTLKSTDTVYDIRVPDGMQYEIQGINVTLESYDNDNFTRYFDFIYDSINGEEGRDYAYNFLKEKGVKVSREKNDDGLLCRITSQGSAKEISDEISALFGGGNLIECNRTTDDMSVVTNVSFIDQINISYMLTGKNKEVPLIYTLYTKGSESISSFSGTSSEGTGDIASLDKDKSSGYKLELDGGEATVKYTATLPYREGIVLYCTISGAMVLITALLILFLIRKNKKLNLKRDEQLKRQAKKAERQLLEKQEELPERSYDERFGF